MLSATTKISSEIYLLLLQVYLCEKLSLVNEMYFAITLDRSTAGPVCFHCWNFDYLIQFKSVYVINNISVFRIRLQIL